MLGWSRRPHGGAGMPAGCVTVQGTFSDTTLETMEDPDMRLVATEYVSLDGIFEEPGQWSFPFFNSQAAAVQVARTPGQRRAPPGPQDLRGLRGRLADDGGHR